MTVPVIYDPGEATAYTLLGEVGERGMEGRTFRAEQVGLARLPVAVKVLTPDSYPGDGDPAAVLAKWRGQLQLVRSFNHEGFAAVQVAFPIAAWPGRETATPPELVGVPAFVMSWIDGQNLDSWSRTASDPLARVAVLRLSAAALDAFHRHAKSVHGDLKPANIMVQDGKTRVIDFGLVRAAERMGEMSVLAGSYAYLDPSVRQSRTFSAAVDVYAFAAIIYKQLTRDVPNPAREAPRVRADLNEKGFGAVAEMLGFALSPHPHLRPQLDGAADLVDRVVRLLEAPAPRPVFPVRPIATDPHDAPTVPFTDPGRRAERLPLHAAPGASLLLMLVFAVLTVAAVLAVRALAA